MMQTNLAEPRHDWTLSQVEALFESVMVSHYDESQGDYDVAVRTLLESPRAMAGNAVSRLHARLLWCQVDASDLVPLRDHVLVPAVMDMVGKPKPDPATLDDLVGLLALAPEPAAADKDATDKWRAGLAALEKPGTKFGKLFRDRRFTADRERKAPPPAMKKLSFCGIGEAATGTPTP